MNFKSMWLWVVAAGVLFGACWFHYMQSARPQPGPQRILPQLRADQVTNVQIRLEGQTEVRAQRDAAAWVLTKPVTYAADGARITALLQALETTAPAIYISPGEVMRRPNAEEEYGFPQATIMLRQGDYRAQVFIGSRTAPGNQVFLQVVGDQGVYVVDEALLKHIPQSADDWRNRVVFDLTKTFDRITVTNAGNGFELLRD